MQCVVAELTLWLPTKIFRVAFALLLFVMVSISVMRIQDYQSEISMWQVTAKYSPEKARVQNNLGYAYVLGGRKNDARTAFTTALKLDAEYYQARFNLLRLDEEVVKY